MKALILPANKHYRKIKVEADHIIARWPSQIGDKAIPGSKIVPFDRFVDSVTGERFNIQAVSATLAHEEKLRAKVTYRGISLLDINFREIWANIFVHNYRESLCLVSCVAALKCSELIIAPDDPSGPLFKALAEQLGLKISEEAVIGEEDPVVTGLMRAEYQTASSLDFHPDLRISLKQKLLILAFNVWSGLVRLVKGGRPFIALSLYTPLKPIFRQMLNNRQYYPLLHQMYFSSLRQLVWSGAKVVPFEYHQSASNEELDRLIRVYRQETEKLGQDLRFGSIECYGHILSIARILAGELGRIAERAFRQIAQNVTLWDNAFKRDRVRGYFGFCDTPWEQRLLVRLAQRGRLPNKIIINGYLSNEYYLEAKTADTILVYGDRLKEEYMNNRAGTLISGNPLYETALGKRKLARPAYPPRKILIGTYGHCAGDINCRYACSESYIRDVLIALKEYQMRHSVDLQLCVKVHPGESLEFYEWQLKELGVENVNLVKKGDIQEIIMRHDLAIFPHSVAMFETALIGVPVFFYLPTNQLLGSPYNRYPALPSAFNRDELADALIKIFANKDYAYSFTDLKTLEPFTGQVDGQTGGRILAEIAKIVTKPNEGK